MPLGDLTQAWVTASAALPLDWLLVGVWLDPDNPGAWHAVARGRAMLTADGDCEVTRTVQATGVILDPRATLLWLPRSSAALR